MCGKILKTIAIFILILGIIIAAIIAGVWGSIGMFFAIFLGTAFSALLLFGFGELIVNTAELRDNTNKQLDEILRQMVTAQKNDQNSKFIANDGKQMHKEELKCKKYEPIKPDAPFIEKAMHMENAAQIAAAFKEKYGNIQNADIHQMIYMLDGIKKNELTYHENMKNSSLKKLATFVKQGMQLYPVDRNSDSFVCPVCRGKQKKGTQNCFDCGALFRD